MNLRLSISSFVPAALVPAALFAVVASATIACGGADPMDTDTTTDPSGHVTEPTGRAVEAVEPAASGTARAGAAPEEQAGEIAKTGTELVHVFPGQPICFPGDIGCGWCIPLPGQAECGPPAPRLPPPLPPGVAH